ncbi:hypothetical protein [Endozoicomonas sp. ONNA2]|uniref:hypothetical protein n=1 Tax=Endozoicomonas sp. ONNA2 TaxID=2828741 RepID=UPI0021480E66|nr:hypothetical protein [Endozoicomonas sp. ONNA2]
MLIMNTPPYIAYQARLTGASYTASSDDGSPLRPETTLPVISGSSERVDLGAGQSIVTRDARKALYAETFNLGLYQHGDTESTIHLPDNKAKKSPCPSTRKSRKPTASSPVSDTIKHEDRLNLLNEAPILAACRYKRIASLQELLEDKKPSESNMAFLNSADRWAPFHLSNTPPYIAYQARLTGASYTALSDDKSPVRPETAPPC